jgi:hypothetical protein
VSVKISPWNAKTFPQQRYAKRVRKNANTLLQKSCQTASNHEKTLISDENKLYQKR